MVLLRQKKKKIFLIFFQIVGMDNSFWPKSKDSDTSKKTRKASICYFGLDLKTTENIYFCISNINSVMFRIIFSTKLMKSKDITIMQKRHSYLLGTVFSCVSFLKSVQKKILQIQHLREVVIRQYPV